MNTFHRYLGSSFQCTINNVNRTSTKLPSRTNNNNNNTKRLLPSNKDIESSQTDDNHQNKQNVNNKQRSRHEWSMNSVAFASSKESWMSMSRTVSK
mmetsp:Transcript_60410/g.54422  ORF Transcript_60410/g.54422 Transcript_60410/m.54422 type:complete len:96 (-) Transcript_60410:61-348(-)